MIAGIDNAFLGQWVAAAFAFVGGIASIGAIAAYFASRRELEEMKRRTENDITLMSARITKLEDTHITIREDMRKLGEALTHSADRRSSVLHNRINPIVENLAALKGSSEALLTAFNTFTAVVKELGQGKKGNPQ